MLHSHFLRYKMNFLDTVPRTKFNSLPLLRLCSKYYIFRFGSPRLLQFIINTAFQVKRVIFRDLFYYSDIYFI